MLRGPQRLVRFLQVLDELIPRLRRNRRIKRRQASSDALRCSPALLAFLDLAVRLAEHAPRDVRMNTFASETPEKADGGVTHDST